MRIAILGAGITGLSLGRMLSDKGTDTYFNRLEKYICAEGNTR